MYYIKKIILFSFLITYAIFSFAFEDSSSLKPIDKPAAMHRTSHIDTDHIEPQEVTYSEEGHQLVKPCPRDFSLVQIQNASQKVYWGPPEARVIFGDCSGLGCWCPLTPYHCCAWCEPPVVRIDKVRWQARPTSNQSSALNENIPSVLSDAGCAPIVTKWEAVG